MRNKIKYLISVFMIIVLSSVCSVASAADDEAVYILNSLGIVKGNIGDIEADKQLSRADAAVWIYNLLGDGATYDYSVFDDVTPGTKKADAVTELYMRKIVFGEEKKFRPNDTITRLEFFSMITNMLGYEEVAEIYGDYPTGILKLMSAMGVDKGVTADSDKLTIKTAARYLVNALEADALEYEFRNGEISYKKSSGAVMNELLDVYLAEGRVEANSMTTLTKPEAEDNRIVIDGKKYTAGFDGADDLLGLFVKAYVHIDNDDDGTVLAAVKKPNRYTEFSVASSDIKESSTRTRLVYDDGGSREDSVKINSAADIIYNGAAYPDATVEEIYPNYGELRLVDRDNDGVYDIVFVTAYSPFVSDGADALRRKLLNKYSGESFENVFVADESDEISITDVFGEDMEFSDITENTVAFIAKPKTGDANRYKIVLSQKSVKGSASHIDISEGTIVIDDEEYSLSDAVTNALANGCLDNLELGKEYSFYFDIYDSVFFYEKDKPKSGYAYIKRAYMDEEADTPYVKLFCEDGEWRVMEVREKVNADNVRMEAADFVRSATVNEIVKYETDADGRLKSIEYPIVTSIDDPNYESYLKKERFTKVNIISERWLLNSQSFEGKYYTPKLECVFTIPSDGNDEDFKITSLSVASEARYSLAMYDLDEFSYGRIAVQTANDEVGLNYTDYMMIVDKVNKMYINDEVVSVVSGYLNGEKVSFTGKDETTFAALKRGDIIRTKYNYASKANGYELCKKANNFDTTSLGAYSELSSCTYVRGYVSAVDAAGGRFRMKDVLNGVSYALRSNTVVTLYDADDNVAQPGTLNDLLAGDYVVLRLRGAEFLELIIIKN